MQEILIVEDDSTLSKGIAMALCDEKIKISQCRFLSVAKQHLADRSTVLVILDINLPDGSGLDLLPEIIRRPNTSVILLTANDTEADIVAGLEMGADDYITKPFSLAVLHARVNTQLRKLEEGTSIVFSHGMYRFEFEEMRYYKNEVPVELSKTEQKLLRLLVENRGMTLTRGRLIDSVWNDGSEFVDDNALSVTVKRLRDKLEDFPSRPEHIKTVYGIGYTWAVKDI